MAEPITEENLNGVILPYKKTEMNRSKVLGIGRIIDDKGREREPGFKAGDIIYHEPYVGQELETDGKTVLFIPYSYVKGVEDDD